MRGGWIFFIATRVEKGFWESFEYWTEGGIFMRGIDRVEFTVHRGAAGGFGLGGLGYPLIS